MNIARFNQLYSGINTAARKVYGAVPMSETWDITQVMREMARLGTQMDYRVVHGCLVALNDLGLVQQSKKGEFRRTPVRDRAPETQTETKPEQEEQPSMKNTPAPVTPPVKQSPLDILAALATRARELTADIESAALVIQEQLEENEASMEKFRQLQALLKGF